ncbi:MAG: putative Ig domain-containing protein [Gammaproteobacteria bacterium]
MIDCTYKSAVRALSGLAAVLALTACGGGGSDSTVAAGTAPESPVSIAPPAGTENHAPVISGTMPPVAVVGAAYSFSPKAVDPDNDKLTFKIASKPSWVAFDASTGKVSGTPAAANVGSHEDIVISVTDGKAMAALPATEITVEKKASATSGSVTVSWLPPTANTDGSTLVSLSGYQIHYGHASKKYTQTVVVENPGLTRFLVEGLNPGKYFFTVTAIGNGGTESEFSSEVSGEVG